MLTQFLYKTSENIIFKGYKLEIFIPESYTSSGLASVEGTVFGSFGILNYRMYNSNDKIIDEGMLNLPTMIYFYFDNYEVRKLTINTDEPEKYVVLTYNNNDIITKSNISKDTQYGQLFVNLVLNGKLSGIPYDRLLDVWNKNIEMTGIKLNISSLIFEIILAEVCRYKNNPDQKFAHYIGENPKGSMIDYMSLTLRSICSRNSTFSAITFEDIDMMITTSLNRTQYNKTQVESPIEKIIKM